MAQAAEHAFNTPFFTGSILMTPKLFTTYRAMNDLSFSKDVQVKVSIRYLSTYKNVYPSVSLSSRLVSNYEGLFYRSSIYTVRLNP
jgi:hypothetical protein